MASKLHMKIHEYNDENGHLLVSFCTDDSKKSVEEYPILSFQPHDFGVDTVAEIIPLLAQRGLDIATRQDAQETFRADTGKLVDINDLVNTTHSFDINDIKPPFVSDPTSTTETLVI